VAWRNGTVMCWGYNGEGQLGINDSYTRFSTYPVDVPGITDAIAIAGGSNITCIIRRDTTVACWGYGWHGDGEGITVKWGVTTVPGIRDITQIAVTNQDTCVLNKVGYFICWGHNRDYYEPGFTGLGDLSFPNPRVIYPGDVKAFAIKNFDYNRRHWRATQRWPADLHGL
jgi:alpha-tubulin suppressor-like RCC1 family protein